MFSLDLDIGPVEVMVQEGTDGTIYWIQQRPPSFGDTVSAEYAASLVNVSEAQVESSFDCQVVSTGLPTLLIPTTSLDAVRDANVNAQVYEEMVSNLEVKAILVFAPETIHDDNHLHVRMFAPALDIPEDPATGSGNGCLAGYLSNYQYFGGGDIDITVEQGFGIERPSKLHLRATSGEDIDISVGGSVSPVVIGELL